MIVATALLFLPPVAAGPSAGEVEVNLQGLRNARGALHLCMTRDPAYFPDCGKDPQAIKHSMPAGSASARVDGISPGTYALSVIHDENRNSRLDTLLGVPREGFGFSGNPVVRFGPPRFNQVRFAVSGGITRVSVKMQYLL